MKHIWFIQSNISKFPKVLKTTHTIGAKRFTMYNSSIYILKIIIREENICVMKP